MDRQNLIDRLMSFRRHQEFGPLRNLLRDAAEQLALDAPQALEEADREAWDGESELGPLDVLAWMEAHGITLMPWQQQKLYELAGSEEE